MIKKLYKIDKRGNTRIWQVEVTNNEYKISTGIDGMGLTHSYNVCEGKNIGKKNETTGNEQAIKEAKSKIKRKMDREGYVENVEDYGQEFSVQLCSNYSKTPKKCVKNATEKMWYQYKLDGLKGYYKDGKIYSRKGTVYEHISESLLNECKFVYDSLKEKFDLKNPILDGELFINNKFWLEDLNSIISGGETLSGYDKDGNQFENIGPDDVKFHLCNVYDDTLKNANFENVIPILESVNNVQITHMKSQPFNFDEANYYLETSIKNGDEGIVIYMNTPYKAGKHDGVWKYKIMKDDEWPIVDFKKTKTLTEKDGTKVDQFQHVCECKSGVRFAVRMEGTNKDREEIGTGKYIGKLLTIRYQGLLKSGKPQFPVGVSIREDL